VTVIAVSAGEQMVNRLDSVIWTHIDLYHLHEVENLETEMVEMEAIDPSSSYEMVRARVIWKQHYHDVQERACRTCGGDPCQIGKVTLTSDHHEEMEKIVEGNVNPYELQIQVGPGRTPWSAFPVAFSDSPLQTQR